MREIGRRTREMVKVLEINSIGTYDHKDGKKYEGAWEDDRTTGKGNKDYNRRKTIFQQW